MKTLCYDGTAVILISFDTRQTQETAGKIRKHWKEEHVHGEERAWLYGGFGMLYWGGMLGAIVIFAGLLAGIFRHYGELMYQWVMMSGSLLCAVFAGLIFRSFLSMTEST